MYQWVAVEDVPEMAWVLDAVRRSIEKIIEEEQAHRTQVAALSQMQLQAMEWVDVQENEIKCYAGGVPDNYKIFARKDPPRNYASSTREYESA